MASKEAITETPDEISVYVDEPARLHLVTRRGKRPELIICGPRLKVNQALKEMGLDPLDRRAIFTDGAYWNDIAFWEMPEIEPEKARRIVRRFRRN